MGPIRYTPTANMELPRSLEHVPMYPQSKNGAPKVIRTCTDVPPWQKKKRDPKGIPPQQTWEPKVISIALTYPHSKHTYRTPKVIRNMH